MKRLSLTLLVCLALSSCADRTRVNCERTKNKALTGVATPENNLGAKCQ